LRRWRCWAACAKRCAWWRSAHAPFGDAPAEAVLGLSKAPALDQRVSYKEADVVARAGVLATRVAQSDDQPVDRTAAAASAERASQRALLLA
jgi:hypothetical protein